MALVTPQVLPKRSANKKQMLSVRTLSDGTIEVRINYSSLELIQTCLRKAYYSLKQGLEKDTIAEPLVFGSAVHKALEVWYCAPLGNKMASSLICEDYQCDPTTVAEGHAQRCARCLAINAFRESGKVLSGLVFDDKRSLDNGTAILNAYFDEYHSDPFVVFSDETGPYVEKLVSHLIHEEPGLRIYLFGTLDLVLRDLVTKELFIVDHKTTWALGTEFYNRINPNFQYTGYVWLVRKALGLDVSRFMVNGIQVARMKRGFARQFTERNDEHFEELCLAVVYNVKKYLECEASESWPQNTPNPCSMYGGCSFRPLCEIPASLRGAVTEANYVQKNADGNAS